MSQAFHPRVQLELLEVKTPCPADWERMSPVAGEERARVRHCGQCDLNVYDISAMTRQEAEVFLLARSGFGRTCVRFYRRDDGTVVTKDCSVIRAAMRRSARRVRFLTSAAALAVAGVLVAGRAPGREGEASGCALPAAPSAPSRLADWMSDLRDRIASCWPGRSAPGPGVQGTVVAGEMVPLMGAVALPRLQDVDVGAASHAVSQAP